MEKLVLVVLLGLCYRAAGEQIETPGSGRGDWFRSTGIKIIGSNQLVFQVKGSRDAILGLATEDRDDAIRWYIAVGRHNNRADCLQSRVPGRPDQTWEGKCRHVSLRSTKYKTFWLSWDQNRIRLGRGNTVGQNQYCEQTSRDTNTPTDFYLRLGSHKQNTLNWIVQLPRTAATKSSISDSPGVIWSNNVKLGSSSDTPGVLWSNNVMLGPGSFSPDDTAVFGSDNMVPDDPDVLHDESVPTSGHQHDPVSIATVVATEVADMIKDPTHMKIAKGLGMMSHCLSYFYSAVGDIVSVATGSEPMLLEMSKGFKDVNAKLKQVQHQVSTLGNSIDWKFRKNTFDTYADKINTLSEKLELLFDGRDAAGFESKRREFIDDYNYYGYDSQEVVNFLTDVEFFNSFAVSTGNDRSKVLDLIKVVLYYVTQTSKIDAAYLRLTGEPQGGAEVWENTLTRVQSELTKVDNRVKNAYLDQTKVEIENFLRLNIGLSHDDFSNRLVKLLSEKYFWRDWFVASYDVTDGDDRHAHAMDGWYRSWFRNNGRNLVVSSLRADDYYNHDIANSAVTRLRGKCQSSQLAYPACCHRDGAKYLSDNISWEGGLNLKLVVQDGRGLYAVSSNVERLIYHWRIIRCRDSFNVVTFM